MIQYVDLQKLTPAEEITGEDIEETNMLKKMLQSSIDYLQSFKWCPPIERVYFGCGIGDVIAVFLFHFKARINNSDEWLWVIEGDLPTAYIVLDQANDPPSALKIYCQLMEDWAKAVLENQSLKKVFPVKAEPTSDNAKILLKRLTFIRTQLLPKWQSNWPS